MEITARAKSLSIDYETGETLLTFATHRKPAEVAEQWQQLQGELDLTVKKHRNKRGLDANAYFHALVGKIALAQGLSFAWAKNDMITSYGQIETDEDGLPLNFWLSESYENIKNADMIHLLVDDVKQVDDIELLHVWKYRGSHTYNTVEMSQLIKGTIQEAEALGIPTVTPAELAELLGGAKCKA